MGQTDFQVFFFSVNRIVRVSTDMLVQNCCDLKHPESKNNRKLSYYFLEKFKNKDFFYLKETIFL